MGCQKFINTANFTLFYQNFKAMNRSFLVALISFSLLLISQQPKAQLPEITLTDSAKVSLLTCSQGDELYSIFGHSAIRVTDKSKGVDWVFNYGTFDFSDPSFYTNFVKGKLNYILSVSTYQNFEYSYIFEERFIYEQELNLNLPEKQKLLDSLRINYMPINRFYLYDFLFDNCATRIRDIFIETIPRSIEFDYGGLIEGKTFRQLLMPYVKEKPWAKLGINMLLGVRADRVAEPWEYMFLPDHMMAAFAGAYLNDNGEIIPFVSPPKEILVGEEIPKSRFRNAPLFVFILFLIITVFMTYKDVKNARFSRWFDAIVFSLVGLLGIVIAFQWFGSDHAVMARNYNLLWTHPLHFIAVIAMFIRPCKNITKYYFGFNTVLMLLLLAFWFLLPQSLPLPMLPLVGALGLRSATIYRFFV